MLNQKIIEVLYEAFAEGAILNDEAVNKNLMDLQEQIMKDARAGKLSEDDVALLKCEALRAGFTAGMNAMHEIIVGK